jgi:4-amino-4-deoxy-L-arabinose transferase-like glycosyltransferase
MENRVRRFWPLMTAALGLALVATWLAFLIQKGNLTNLDECLTGERSREMLLLGPVPVHENFQPSFQKPPLQYWLSAFTLSHLRSREAALRIWPLLYGMLSAVALAWLTFLLEPKRPWLMPLAALILLMCPIFLPETCRALLDAGLAFFSTLAFIFAHLARKRPGWWLAVATVCVLGALQKTPFPFLIWLIILLVRFANKEERALLRSRWLFASLSLAVVGISIWPLLLVIKFGMPLARILNLEELPMIDNPAHFGARPYLEIPFRLMTTWPCGAFALLALFYFIREKRSHRILAEVALVCLTIIFLGVIGNLRSARYVVPILPMLGLLLAMFVHLLIEQRRRAATVTAVVILLLSSAGLEVSRHVIDRRRKDHSAQRRVAEELGRLQEPNLQLVVVDPDKHVLPEQFFLFYGELRFPVTLVFAADLPRTKLQTPAAGVCAVRDLPLLQSKFPNLSIARRSGEFVCWNAR